MVTVMSGDPAGGDSHLRMSDRDREQVVGRLYEAVGGGRITMAEFEDRLTSVLAARTFGDVLPCVADPPTTAPVSGAAQIAPVLPGTPWCAGGPANLLVIGDAVQPAASCSSDQSGQFSRGLPGDAQRQRQPGRTLLTTRGENGTPTRGQPRPLTPDPAV
jgi:hypothetical protein